MNTSVIITYKNGTQRTFTTIEEASEVTGLSITAIKGRATKGIVPKDGVKCEWVDPHTKKAFMAKSSKRKGNNFELEIVNKLKTIGYPMCATSRSESKSLDNKKVDVYDPTLPCYIQAKYTQNLPNYFEIKKEAPQDKPFCMAWKKASKDGSPSPGTVVVIPIDYFYQLITRR